MSVFLFNGPAKIIYGRGAIRKAGAAAKSLGQKALIVTGKNSAHQSGALQKLIASLESAGLDYVVFDKVESDPDVETVEAGASLGRENAIDCIVALGGGSPMDAAKAMSMIINTSGRITDYESKAPTAKGLPMVAVPTTAGTGSEVSQFTVITDNLRKIKMLIGGESLIPRIAILDPDLTVTMPPVVTAATGMDALTHAIEAYISKVAQPMSEAYALKAIELISSNLVKAVLNGENIEARENMLRGQMYAGLAFSNASVALVHAMSRPLGVHFKIPHGVANAILLPKVMAFNCPCLPEKFTTIAALMGENTDGLSSKAGALLAIKAVCEMYEETGLPKHLSELGVTEESIDRLAEDAFHSGSTLMNPRKTSLENIKAIYRDIY